MKLRILCISVLITFAGILAYSFISSELYYDSSVKGMRGTLSVYMNAFDESYYSLDGVAAEAFSEQLDGARVTFIDSEGEVLADSAAEVSENHLGREEVATAIKDGEGFAVRRSSTVSIDYIYYCRRFAYADETQNGSLSLTRYPKAGQTNPSVRVGVAAIDSGETVWADFDYSLDQYFGTPFWSPDSRELFVPREPRRQNTLELYAVSAADGSLRQVYREEYPTWVDWIDDMLFTDDGFYMARSFETGWEQIYFLGYDGSLERLTDGENWDIRLLRTDSKGSVWFTAKRDSRLHSALYLLDRRGRATALTDPELSVSGVEFSEDGRSFTARVSNARTPAVSIRGRSDRLDCEQISDAAGPADGLPVPEIVRIENDGFDLYALMSLPEDFDPSRKYPVVMQLYGGPGTPYVRDVWRDRDASDDWCFRNGVIYIVCDPRSSGENGREGMDQAFRQMTVIELEDYIAWARWLQSLPYVDGSRIGVKGFSFGGTTTAMLVLRFPQYFRCGIAGGGVYDWTLYDSHYTERFMDTPQANPEGYEAASVLSWVPEVFASADTSARPLPGALRLTHGTGDDNVHYQNTLLLMDALQKAGSQFEVMLYPDGMHGYRGYQGEHDKAAEAAFWTKWLLE